MVFCDCLWCSEFFARTQGKVGSRRGGWANEIRREIIHKEGRNRKHAPWSEEGSDVLALLPSGFGVGAFFGFEGFDSHGAQMFEGGDAVGAEEKGEDFRDHVVEFAAIAEGCEFGAVGAGGVASLGGAGFDFAVSVHGFWAVAAGAFLFAVHAAVGADEAAVGEDEGVGLLVHGLSPCSVFLSVLHKRKGLVAESVGSESFVEGGEGGFEISGKSAGDLVEDYIGDGGVEGFGDATGDGGLGVGVAAEGDGVSDGIFEVGGVEESDDGLGNGAGASEIGAIAGADGVNGSG